ncbi:hypothetical protein BHE74_00016724 [Ensete ventricosum]|nr:hypothetical protein BHE74_00016724 [Ensete ventricosum]RZS08976.1 hypothetical protein BHM03_00040012 [Ensete ventricosum]
MTHMKLEKVRCLKMVSQHLEKPHLGDVQNNGNLVDQIKEQVPHPQKFYT